MIVARAASAPGLDMVKCSDRDVLVCTLENALLPAARALIQMGKEQGVRDSRTQLQAATAQLFIDVIEEQTGPKV